MSCDTRLSKGKIFALGLLLFAMFLGAGNTIFAPMVGQGAGESLWLPMSGFLLTGVGLVLLAIIALTLCGGDIEALASRVSPKFSAVFCLLLFLALGPLYVIPRTTSVVYEIAVRPSLNEDLGSGPWVLLGFSVVFTFVSMFLSMNPSKLVDRIGKAITPVFTILLAIIVIRSILAPMGELQPAKAPYTEQGFLLGFTDGYGTMDALAALVFAGVFIQSIRGLGVRTRRGIAWTFLKAGLVTVTGLALLHISLAWIGASSVDAIGRPDNGGELLAEASRVLLGYPGVLMIGAVILLTGLTTNVACISCVADYLGKKVPSLSYRGWVFVVSFVGLIFANFGLTLVLNTALPILYLLYPIGMTLIVLALADMAFGGYRAVYVGAMVGASAVAVVDSVKAAGPGADQLDDWFSFLPLFSAGAGWVIPAVLGGIIGYIVAKVGHHQRVERPAQLKQPTQIERVDS